MILTGYFTGTGTHFRICDRKSVDYSLNDGTHPRPIGITFSGRVRLRGSIVFVQIESGCLVFADRVALYLLERSTQQNQTTAKVSAGSRQRKRPEPRQCAILRLGCPEYISRPQTETLSALSGWSYNVSGLCLLWVVEFQEASSPASYLAYAPSHRRYQSASSTLSCSSSYLYRALLK